MVTDAGAAPSEQVEHRVQSLGEHPDLLLLQRDTRGARPVVRLEEEGPLPGRADRSGDEALRVEVGVHGHRFLLLGLGMLGAGAAAATDGGVITGGLRRLRLRRDAGADTSPPESFMRSTNGLVSP